MHNTTISSIKSNNLNNMSTMNTPYVNKSVIMNQHHHNQQNPLMQSSTSSGNHLVHRNVRQLQDGSQLNTTKSTPNGHHSNNNNNNQLNFSLQHQPNQSKHKNSNPNISVLNATTNFAQPQNLPPPSSAQQQHQPISVQQQPPPPPPPPPSSLAATAPARTLLPRPIVAPNRTFFDKLLDFVIGEGPNNRYLFFYSNKIIIKHILLIYSCISYLNIFICLVLFILFIFK